MKQPLAGRDTCLACLTASMACTCARTWFAPELLPLLLPGPQACCSGIMPDQAHSVQFTAAQSTLAATSICPFSGIRSCACCRRCSQSTGTPQRHGVVQSRRQPTCGRRQMLLPTACRTPVVHCRVTCNAWRPCSVSWAPRWDLRCDCAQTLQPKMQHQLGTQLRPSR